MGIHLFASSFTPITQYTQINKPTDTMVAGPKRPTAGGGGLKGGPKKNQKITKKFVINATQPTQDRIFDPSAFATFLQQRIKVVAHKEFSGRYLKYLTKKFLKKQQLRDWLRVVSTSKGVYELRFFDVVNDEGDEDEE